MKSWKTILTLACAAVMLAGSTGSGATYYSRTNGDWDDDHTWSFSDCTGGQPPVGRGDYPQGGDDAIVCGARVVTLTAAATVDSLYIDDGEVDTGACVLTITDSGGLTIDADELLDVSGSGGVTLSGGGTHTVNGTIELDTTNSDLTITGDNVTVDGTGEIDGQNDGALISINGVTLTNGMDTIGITGALQIVDGASNGSFTNNGIVDANDGTEASRDTLLIDVGGALDDSTTSADRWIVSANGAILEFASTIGTFGPLDGHFVMTTGDSSSEIRIYHSVVTDGQLQMSVGTLDINPDDPGGSDSVTMGDDVNYYMNVTGGQIEVAADETFTHN